MSTQAVVPAPDPRNAPIITTPRTVLFATEQVSPPTNLYVTQEDQLRVMALGTTGLLLSVIMRMLLPNGLIVPIERDLPPQTNYTTQINTYPLPEGFLLDCIVTVAGTGVARGQAYALVQIVRGPANALIPMHTIIADYVSSGVGACFPNGQIRAVNEGPGWFNDNPITPPGPGGQWGGGLGANTRLRLRAVYAILTTSAAVANRLVFLNIYTQPAGYYICSIPASIPQPASTAWVYSWFAGAPQVAPVASGIICPLPIDLTLGPTAVITSAVLAMQAGDQWSAITVTGEQLFDSF
jgi:hypothetical protein